MNRIEDAAWLVVHSRDGRAQCVDDGVELALLRREDGGDDDGIRLCAHPSRLPIGFGVSERVTRSRYARFAHYSTSDKGTVTVVGGADRHEDAPCQTVGQVVCAQVCARACQIRAMIFAASGLRRRTAPASCVRFARAQFR